MLWRKNKEDKKELPSFLKKGITRFNGWLITIAGYLQARTNGYSIKRKRFLLLAFIIVFTTESILITIRSFKENRESFIAVTRIKTIPLQKENEIMPRISKPELLKIQRFKKYIDSLSSSARGRQIKDSLLHNRPHLMDSVNLLINLFFNNKKTQEK